MQKVIDIFAEADEKIVAAFIKAKVPLIQGVIPEGKGLFVPWGWVTAEKNDNNADSAGWRWTLVGDSGSENFDKLCSFSVPQDPTSLKANSTAALLSKIVDAINNDGVPTSSPLALKSTKASATKKEAGQQAIAENNPNAANAVAPPDAKTQLMKQEQGAKRGVGKDVVVQPAGKRAKTS